MITLRPYVLSDAEECQKIYERSLKENKHGFIQDLSYHGTIKEQFNSILSNDGSVVVAIDRKSSSIVGFCALVRAGDQEDHSHEIAKLHVLSSYQGQGIGQKIVESLISEVKKQNGCCVHLDVTKTQTKALNLYQKLGFKQIKNEICTVQVNDQNMQFDTIFMCRKIAS